MRWGARDAKMQDEVGTCESTGVPDPNFHQGLRKAMSADDDEVTRKASD